MKNAGLREDSIIRVLNAEGEFIRRGTYNWADKNPTVESNHNLRGLKPNITQRFGDFTDYEGKITLRDKDHAKRFEEFLNETIIEYELKEINRMTMRQYLERMGKLTRPGDE